MSMKKNNIILIALCMILQFRQIFDKFVVNQTLIRYYEQDLFRAYRQSENACRGS